MNSQTVVASGLEECIRFAWGGWMIGRARRVQATSHLDSLKVMYWEDRYTKCAKFLCLIACAYAHNARGHDVDVPASLPYVLDLKIKCGHLHTSDSSAPVKTARSWHADEEGNVPAASCVGRLRARKTRDIMLRYSTVTLKARRVRRAF